MKDREHLDQTSGDEFADAVIVRADEPSNNTEDGILLTRREFELCASEPLGLVVLLHWRARERDGQPCTAEAIWATLTSQGMHGADGETPVALDEVDDAVNFLVNQDLVSIGGEL